MEPQKYAQQMQQEMIREIEAARPKYLISVAMNYSWLQRPDSTGGNFQLGKRIHDPKLHGSWVREYYAD